MNAKQVEPIKEIEIDEHFPVGTTIEGDDLMFSYVVRGHRGKIHILEVDSGLLSKHNEIIRSTFPFVSLLGGRCITVNKTRAVGPSTAQLEWFYENSESGKEKT